MRHQNRPNLEEIHAPVTGILLTANLIDIQEAEMKNDGTVATLCLLALLADWLFIRMTLAKWAAAADFNLVATLGAAAAFAAVCTAILGAFLRRIIRRAAAAGYRAASVPPIGLFRQSVHALFAPLLRKVQ